MKNLKLLVVGLLTLLAALAGLTFAEDATDKARAKDFFKSRIAPLLKKHCLECHNPDKSRGGLDLSRRATLLEGGEHGPAIVPGDAKKGLLLDMIAGPKPKMPKMRDPLRADEVADMRRWIDDGALWPEDVVLTEKKSKEEWWSLKPLSRPALPEVKDKEWSDNPLDRFILAALEAKGMKPSAPADRATFIRRVTYDLTGLPPTPEEIDAFVNDAAADAFEKLVDRLLASPRYGERWARHWLDIIHYADTHGFDKDKRRLWAWLLRDWVIRAFNRDLPYRRFVEYQLAGDALFPADPDGIIATGFITTGPWDFVGQVELREGTVEKDKTRNLDRDDMVMNAFSTFTSLTVHCARCHDHKFDPITQKEYYQLQAIFAGVERGDRPVESKETLAVREDLQKKLAALKEEQEKLLATVRANPELARHEKTIKEAREQIAALSKPTTAPASPSNGYHSGISPKADAMKWVQVDLGASLPLERIRLVPARPTDFKDSPGFGFPVRFKVALSDDPTFKSEAVVLDHLAEDFANPGDIPLSLSLAGKKARFIRVTAARLWKRLDDYVFALAELTAISGGKNVASGAKVTALDSIEAGRWSTRYLVDQFDSRRRLPDVATPDMAERLNLEEELLRAIGERETILKKAISPETTKALAAFQMRQDGLAKDLEQLHSKSFAYTVLPRPPRPIHLLKRGDVEKKGELVLPVGLSLLKGLDKHFAPLSARAAISGESSFGRARMEDKVKEKTARALNEDEGARRAALAHWMTDDHNVLVWRSIVNRVWHYHFGKGLVDTPNDFGRMGSKPSHPELLDWLACEFRDKDSFKKLHRLIVLSKAYRQAATHNADYAKLDADNRLLWRMNRRRLDAEELRDTVLAVSGKLDLTMYGPGFDLFRFKDDHSPTYDHLDLKRVNAPDTWRRTVYRFVVRSVPNPFLETLDCADPNLNVPARSQTLTALQALALLNNPFMVEQAEFLGQRISKIRPELPGQIDTAYRLALGRPPDAEEKSQLIAYARRHGLANACRVLFNVNEFLFLD
ncbi:MAG: DUF1553 domain-containing protein [Gemmataceae bacterium]